MALLMVLHMTKKSEVVPLSLQANEPLFSIIFFLECAYVGSIKAS